MVNKDLLDYFSEGKKRGIDVERLKKRLLENGWNEKDIDEAINSSEYGENSGAQEEQPLAEKTKTKGFKWMKLAGIVGIILLVLQLAAIGYSIFSPSPETIGGEQIYGQTLPLFSPGIVIFIIIIFILLIEIFYFGFVRMGKSTQSKLLKFASILLMILPAIAVILLLISINLLESIALDLSAALGGGGETPMGKIYTLLAIWGGFMIIYLITQLLFAIGLIKVRKKVNSLTAGIFNLLIFIFAIVGLTLLGFMIGEVMSMGLLGLLAPSESFLALYGALTYVNYIEMASFVLAVLFSSLALFDASKKFEQ